MNDTLQKLIYTVSTCFTDREQPCPNCEHLNCVTLPNNPRMSIDGRKGIVTGVFELAYDAEFLSQTEAEALMQTPDWHTPDPEQE